MSKPVKKAVFPVAGLGTRFLPATKVMPKEMLTVVDKPLIQYAVEEAFEAGIDEIIFVTGRNKGALEDHFDHAYELEATLEARGKTEPLAMLREQLPEPGKVRSVRQQAPLGLGHAVWCAKDLVGDEPFAVILPDDLILAQKGVMAQMVEAYEKDGGNLVAVMDVPRELTGRYGILDIGKDGGITGSLVEVTGLVEKPDPADAPSTLSIIGRYILQPEIFTALEAHETGQGGEIQLTDAMAKLIGKQPFNGLRYAGTRYDCGDKLGFLQANVAFALNRNESDGDLGPRLKDWLSGLKL